MRQTYTLAAPIALLLALAACGKAPSATLDETAGPLAEGTPKRPPATLRCPETPALSRTLADGVAPENTPAGACFARAARLGDTGAAQVLGDIYTQALSRRAPGKAASIDLFGRQITWYRAAAAAGQPQAEIRLAQALDFDQQIPLPDEALAYYLRAARHGAPAAVDAVAQAWTQGRISPANIVDFRIWLKAQAPSSPVLNRAISLLDSPPPIRL